MVPSEQLWSKKVLIPFWTYQILFTLFLIANYMLVAVYLFDQYNEHRLPRHKADDIILMLLYFLLLALLIAQVVYFHRKRLTLRIMLYVQIYQSVFLFVAFLLEVLGFTGAYYGGSQNGLDFIGTMALAPAIWASLIYTIVIYKRVQKRARVDAVNEVRMENLTFSHKGDERFDDQAGPA